MGLAYINNTVDRISKPDPILLWQIPQEWSFEDAVTVPLIYIQVNNKKICVRHRYF